MYLLTDMHSYVHARWYNDTTPWDPLDEDGEEDEFDPVSVVFVVLSLSASHTTVFQEIHLVDPFAAVDKAAAEKAAAEKAAAEGAAAAAAA